MSNVKKVICPHCDSKIDLKRGAGGRWVGTISGGGIGYVLGSSLGIAGTILGAPIAIPAAIVVGVLGTILGNRAGNVIDNEVMCPKCRKNMSV